MVKERHRPYLKCCAGEPEPSTMSEGKNVYELRTHTHENRVVDEVTGHDRIVRRSLKAPSIEELKDAAADPDNSGKSSSFLLFCWGSDSAFFLLAPHQLQSIVNLSCHLFLLTEDSI
jgi:hypothetical protein